MTEKLESSQAVRLEQTRNSAKASPQRGSGVKHARKKGNDIVSKPNFAVQIIEMSVSFCFTLWRAPASGHACWQFTSVLSRILGLP